MHKVRRMEFEATIRHVPMGRNSCVLELGCGDGFQTALLRERFDHVFSIDPEHVLQRGEQRFAYAVAEALPFNDSAFDLVFSNCVLEHLEDRRIGVAEAVRVLRPGGYMAHVVPGRFWKAASLCFNPIGYPLRVAEKWRAMRRLAREGNPGSALRSGGRLRPSLGAVLSRWVLPPIHGSYPSHISEYRMYGRRYWDELFKHPGLVPVAELRLPCATQFGFLRFRLISLRKRMGELGLNSSLAFIMRRGV